MHGTSIWFSIYPLVLFCHSSIVGLMTSLKPPGTVPLDVVTSAQWHILAKLKHADRSMMTQNIEMAGSNHEKPLGTIALDDPIQFESNTSHDKENADHASHPNPAQASEENTLPSHDASTSSHVHCTLCSGLWCSLLNQYVLHGIAQGHSP